MCVSIISSGLDGTRVARNCHCVTCEPQYPTLMKMPMVRRRGWRPGLCKKASGAGFLILDATNIAGWAVLRPVDCRLFGNSGLSPRDARGTLHSVRQLTKNVSTHCRVSLREP